MKRAVSLILAAIFAASVLASCRAGGTSAAISPNVRVTSSDGADAAAWLTARLGEKLTGRVVLGTDADGYVIRSLGGECALFARTTEGLDRAVRRYAKATERGEEIADETYHEGARVKRFTVAGEDISTFAIRVEGPGRDEDVSRLRERVESSVAASFEEFIALMCGASLADEADAKHFVIFRPSADESFTEGDFRYAVEDGDLVFEYCELLGADNALVTFFEDECGWQGLDAGRDMLPESEHIDVAADRDVTVDAMLDGLLLPSRSWGTQNKNSAYTACPDYRSLYGIYSRVPHACNGWLTYRWGDFDVGNATPCMSNSATLDLVVDSIVDYVDAKCAAGAVVGYDLNYIDIAHGDTNIFCECYKCNKIYAAEGSRSGASVLFANGVAEALEDAGYAPLKIITYAYRGNYAPCKTRPRDDVYVTFCIHGRCINHPLDASICTEITHPYDRVGPANFAAWMKGWGELTDNLYLWDYLMDYNLHPYVLVDQIWDDMHYMRECRVTRSYWECHQCGVGTMELSCQLVLWLNRHPDATRGDYDAKYREFIELHYGDGWEKVWEALDLWESAEDAYDGCCLGWQFTMPGDPTQMDYAFYLNECQEKMLVLFDGAARDAKCAEDVREIELLSACCLYLGCYGGYFYVTETDDAEYEAILEERYAEATSILSKYGVTFDVIGYEGASYTICDDFGEMGRTAWDIMTPYVSKTAREIVVKQFALYDGGGNIRLGEKMIEK